MDEEKNQQDEDQASNPASDPWAEAFAALDKEEEKTPPSVAGEPKSDDAQDTKTADMGDGAADASADDGDEVPPAAGGPGDLGGADSGEDAGTEDSIFRISQERADEYRESLKQSIEEQTLHDVANAYIKQGCRHIDGKLGASIYDPDICKRDEDGVPHFYNPKTGQEFSGSDPRATAQNWVDDYNHELSVAFNKTCADYAKKLMDEKGVGLTVIDFAPKYEKLDPVRRAMFESIIEDYEVHDEKGELIGYSCDLDKALSAVNRQVKTMQERFKNTGQATPAPSGPALDMKSSSRDSDDSAPKFNSIAEAMEYQQDQLLKKMKEGK
jgi:hypothetical protein